MIQQEQAVLEFELNNAQARALTVMSNEMWCVWGRGTGKTQGVIAPWLLHKVEHMPQSTGGFLGASFADIETKYLKPLFEAFGMMGHKEDVDYVYGKEPPASWKKPYIPTIDYSHVLSFPNGTSVESVSLHKKGSANALSLQWIIGDEAKLLDQKKLTDEVMPILRGNAKYFGDSPWYAAKLFVTDKLSPNIHWILEKKKLIDAELSEAIIVFQLEVNELVLKMAEASEAQQPRIRKKLSDLTAVLSVLRKKCVFYSEAKAAENIKNLRPEYFDVQKRSMSAWQYSISIDNEDPRKVENGFYASRTDKHLYDTYTADDDVTKPLAIALDYQASISPLVAAQLNNLVVPGKMTLNFLQSHYVKQPLGLKHVVDDFCEANADRLCKHVLYFYDSTAVGERNTHKKYYEEVEAYFIANGWRVTLIYMGMPPRHGNKYNRLSFYFENENLSHPPIRINRDKCADMVLSMDQTATKEVEREGTKKDKSSERDKDFPQEQSTHFGDTFDQLVWGILELGKYVNSNVPLGRVGFSKSS